MTPTASPQIASPQIASPQIASPQIASPQTASYPDFRDQWIQESLDNASSSVQKGHDFAVKIVRQWLEIGDDEDSQDLIYCDGAGDGGIDLAFLKRGEVGGEGEVEGDTWYLVQSKYGKAFQGENTLVEEGRKIIDTLDGSREKEKLTSLSNTNVLERLHNFLKKRGESDRLVLVFATVDPIGDKEKKAIEDVRVIALKRLGFNVEFESISLHTIFSRTLGEGEKEAGETHICVALPLQIPQSAEGAQLLVGTVSLPDVYKFLSDYKQARGDLEVLYARNVRVFLGAKGKVNKYIAKTLNETPEVFGFYNNGITLVVSDFHAGVEGTLQVCDPEIVNGCQTTRSIWEVFEKKLNSGGTGKDRELAEWESKVHQGTVIVKIVRVGAGDTDLLTNITRYTNSQNAVKDQDFMALQNGFRAWQTALETQRIYLEIQRGGSDAQKARQKNKSKAPYDHFINAFDLFKVYGAGWLGEPGQAWSKNAAFAPKGEFFNQIVQPPFGAADLLECFHLQNAALERSFGGKSKDTPPPRRLTRFLFFFVTLELLRTCLTGAQLSNSRESCTQALCALRESPSGEWKALLDAATTIIDNYMKSGALNSVSKDPVYEGQFGGNLNSYLKSDHFAKKPEFSPGLWHWLGMMQLLMSMPAAAETPLEQRISRVLKSTSISAANA